LINVRLNLRPAAAAVHPVAAWFIAGSDAAAWLAEIEQWGLPTAALRFYALPAGPNDLSPAGVLVVTPPDASPRQVLRAQPYGRLARKLYLPADAILWPPVADEELAAQLLFPTLVLHPSLGLVGFADEDALRVHDLLETPPMRELQWDRAVPGQDGVPRIRSVEPLDPPDVHTMLEDGRSDIGSRPPSSLPRGPDESRMREAAQRGLISPAMHAAALAIGPLKFLAWLSGKVRAKAGEAASAGKQSETRPAGPGWAQQLYENLSGKLDRLSGKLLDQRQQSLERLKRLLTDDPDEGLRHAISLRELHGRGVAAPSASLPTRDVRFSLTSALGGGGRAVDSWEMPPDMVQELSRQYRQAANRELRLGRYERAAYIYAELLGDYAAAANSLEQGHFYREAATIYKQKLGNPQRAAVCLEQAGLLVEAAIAFSDLKQFEHAGDLYTCIDQPEEAAGCYERAVSQAVARSDLLEAARLLESKLDAPDRALNVLDSGWPDAAQASGCLRATFELLGRLLRHDAALARVAALRGDAIPRGKDAAVVQALADVACDYPEARIRGQTADATRVVAARVLASPADTDVRSVVQNVRRLAPEDRLLGRDVARYIDRPTVTPAPAVPDARIRDVVVVRQFRLPGDVNWVDMELFDAGFCAVGWTADEVATLAGVLWSGARTSAQWLPKPRHFGMDELRLHAIPGERRIIAAVPFDKGSEARLTWTSPAVFGIEPPLTVARPSWLPDSATTIAVNERGVVWELADDEVQNLPDPVLTAYNASDGHLLSSHSLPLIGWPDANDWHPAMVAIRDVVYAAWGNGVLRFIPLTETRIDAMPSIVTGLIASHDRRDRKVVAVMKQGCALLSQRGHEAPFAQHLTDPVAAFLRSGRIVALDGSGVGCIYDLQGGGQPRRVRTFPVVGERPFKVIGGRQLHQFATISSAGQVTIYQAPA